MSDAELSRDDQYWTVYQKGRPQIPDSFFERIYTYHAEHGGELGVAHDAGAGGGMHSARLAKRFDKVLISDVSEEHISIAKARVSGPQYEFKAMTLESSTELPAASVDLVFASTMLHFCDIDKALAAVAHQLKPGGTFAASVQGVLRFDDPKIQEKYVAFFHTGSDQFRRKFGDRLDPIFQVTASGYDLVALPDEFFHLDSLRLRLNEPSEYTPGGGTFYEVMAPRQRRQDWPLASRIGANERVVFEDDDDWIFRGDVNTVKELADTYTWKTDDAEMKPLWDDLVEAIGAGKVTGRWPVYLILATRK